LQATHQIQELARIIHKKGRTSFKSLI
jgi:hypothetical protein